VSMPFPEGLRPLSSSAQVYPISDVPGNNGPPAPMTALLLFASYDRLRLQIYREHGPCGERIKVGSIGSVTLLRFEDVGYFNRVYAPDEAVSEQLAEVEAFYDGSPFGCELIGPTNGSSCRIDRECLRQRWVPGERYAWLAAPPAMIALPEGTNGFEVRPPGEAERELFLLAYLRGFEANTECVPAAVQNMRHLFKCPDLRFLMAFRAGRPAGIGMLYFAGKVAVLCAGATLPEYRRQGCHTALLRARLRLAVEQDCENIFSWAAARGQSHANMERAGLQTVGITAAWRLPADRERRRC